VVTRAGTDTMPPRREGTDDVEEDTDLEAVRCEARVSRFGTRSCASMTPPGPSVPLLRMTFGLLCTRRPLLV
jgi:hypothetical protein